MSSRTSRDPRSSEASQSSGISSTTWWSRDWLEQLSIRISNHIHGRLSSGLLRATNVWFRIYRISDGKPENHFAFSGEGKFKKCLCVPACHNKNLNGKLSDIPQRFFMSAPKRGRESSLERPSVVRFPTSASTWYFKKGHFPWHSANCQWLALSRQRGTWRSLLWERWRNSPSPQGSDIRQAVHHFLRSCLRSQTVVAYGGGRNDQLNQGWIFQMLILECWGNGTHKLLGEGFISMESVWFHSSISLVAQ